MSVANNIARIRNDLQAAEKKYRRLPNSVILLAISKLQSLSQIKSAIDAGQMKFGENYLQEALKKIEALKKYAIEWHFVGTIQANKTRAIAENFSWAHCVCRGKIAERLNSQRPAHLPPLNVCIQVNSESETHKSGIEFDELEALAFKIKKYDRLHLRGLMAIPEFRSDFFEQQRIFEKVAKAQRRLVSQGFSLDTLSMGMTQDFVAAIAAGSTMVRIGEGIFGKRK